MLDKIISKKELASALQRSLPYVQAMQKRGFQIKSGRTTLNKALLWLERHPKPLSKRAKP